MVCFWIISVGLYSSFWFGCRARHDIDQTRTIQGGSLSSIKWNNDASVKHKLPFFQQVCIFFRMTKSYLVLNSRFEHLFLSSSWFSLFLQPPQSPNYLSTSNSQPICFRNYHLRVAQPEKIGMFVIWPKWVLQGLDNPEDPLTSITKKLKNSTTIEYIWLN